MLNYELGLRGRNQFQASSQNIVLNKSSDLIKDNFHHLNKFKKQAKDIKSLKGQWSCKMEEMEKKGMTLKEAASLAQVRKRLQDLRLPKKPDTTRSLHLI